MSERERRIGLNEAVFREVNERLKDINQTFDFGPTLDILCECGDASCNERISISRADYEQVRADQLQFAMVPGHETATVEVVIARMKTYDLVRKRPGLPAALAAEISPRES